MKERRDKDLPVGLWDEPYDYEKIEPSGGLGDSSVFWLAFALGWLSGAIVAGAVIALVLL